MTHDEELATMSADATDDEILALAQAGDPAACALCIDTYGPLVYRLALRLMQNEADAEDVVQETFINAFKAVDRFEGRSGLGTWLYRITYNNAMMRLRKNAPDDLDIDSAVNDGDAAFRIPEQMYDWCCLPEKDFRSSEVRHQLSQAVDDLSPALRSVFTLRELEGLSTAETAESLDISEASVKTRLHRARLQLRESLSEYFSERLLAE